MRKTLNNIILLAVTLIVASCSTTRRLGDGEVLYTGVRKMVFEPDSGVELSSAAESAARKQLSVKPNNPLFSPYVRTPLPIGLWAYNYLNTDRERGLKRWLYDRLAKPPVLISDVQPELRSAVAAQVLGDYGYFASEGRSQLRYRKNGRKAKVLYALRVAPPWYYSSVEYPEVNGDIGRAIDSLSAVSRLRAGVQYNLDSLTAERAGLVMALRNDGYYYMRPDYLEYLADTTVSPRSVALRLRFVESVPTAAFKRWSVDSVVVHLESLKGGAKDTLDISGLGVISTRPLKIRPRLLERAVGVRSGDRFTPAVQSQAVGTLNKLGIFRSVDFAATPADSTVDLLITAYEAPPVEAALEGDVTSKSNSFLGPGVSFRVSHNNLFRGGEVLTVRLGGQYEWQTGRTEGRRLHSYEAGLHSTLDIPRLLPARLMRFATGEASTSLELGADLVSRPQYFRMVSFGGSMGWKFSTSPHRNHQFTLASLKYNRLLHTTESFDKTLDENPAIALSFRDQFIPSSSYTYTYDSSGGEPARRRFWWQSMTMSAGNLLSAAMHIAGKHEPQHLFGLAFSQFVKQTEEVKFFMRLGRKTNTLAMRFMVGAGYAYGNSKVMPYSEQFHIGGANSIRAFAVRSIGPGSYRPDADDSNGYLDQTGDFRLEANVEYRFGIAGDLNGALFLDAGNIWLLRQDADRPGAELNRRTFGREIALGTGVGVRYDLGFLVLRLDMGIPLHAPYDTGRKGYYNIEHFGLSLAFHLAIGYPF